MVKQILNKVTAILIVLALTIGNLMLVATESYAAFEELEEQKTVSSDRNINFDTYFYVEESKKHSATLNIAEESIINYEIKVEKGYLRNSSIELANANYEIIGIESQSIEGIVANFEKDKIILNQINSNTNVVVSAKIKSNHGEMVQADYLGKETTAILKGNYTNIKGKTEEIQGRINTRIDYVAEVTSSIEENVEKYMHLNNKTIIQTKVTSTINQNVLPIKTTNIKINAPKIKEMLPEEVRVHAKSTKATNGIENGNYFTNSNYTYNKENGEVQINVENAPNSENKISWKNGSTDEYIVIYIYGTIEPITNIQLNAQNNITTYLNNVVTNKVEKTQEIKLSGNNVDYNIQATKEVNKGYMYANSNYETQYQTIYSANISYTDATNELVFAQETDKFLKEKQKAKNVNSYYKQIKINKDNFSKILGEEGQVQILNAEKLIATINKDTSLDENGNYVFNFGEPISNIVIKTCKPISEGKIIIENTKAIGAKSPYTLEEIKQFKVIENSLIGTSQNQEAQTLKANTNLNETSTKAQVQIGKENLSTIITNENVEIRAILETDDITDDLYKNPSIRIELPQEVESIKVKSANVLFGSQLKIVNSNIEAGRIINIQLKGEQTEFITDGNKGLTLIFNTDITLNKTAANREAKVTMNYTNEKAVAMQNNGVAEAKVNIVAPTGVITLNSVTNTTTGKTATSLEEKQQETELKRKSEVQTATYTNTIINNNEQEISNVKIIGNVSSKGDKQGSTINTKLATAVTLPEGINYTVYYSENQNANTNLEEQQNGWTAQITPNTKTYLIVINEAIEKGKLLTFTYNVELPENLNYGAKAISTYKVEYTEGNVTSNEVASISSENFIKYAVATTEEATPVRTEEATPVALTTGEGPILQVTLQDNIVNETAYVGQYITYKVILNNNGTADAENVKINMQVPEGMAYAKYIGNEEYELYDSVETIEVGNIPANATITKEIKMYVEQADKTLQAKATISADNIQNIETNTKNFTTTNNITSFRLSEITSNVIENETYYYEIIIEDTQELKNVKIDVNIPNGLEFVDMASQRVYMGDSYEIKNKFSKKDNKITITLENIESNKGRIYLYIYVNTTQKIENGEIYATLTCDKGTQTTNKCNITTSQKKAEVEVVSNIQENSYIKVGDCLEYEIKIKNTGEIDINYLTTKIYTGRYFDFPKEVSVNGEKLNKEEYSYLYGANISVTKNIEKGKEYIIKAKIPIDPDNMYAEDKETSVKIEIEDLNYSKEFKYTLEKYLEEGEDPENPNNPDNPNPDNPDNPNNPENPNPENKYKISGIAWLDINKDGKMDENETKLPNIPVKAINASGKVVSNTTTTENGTYTIENLPKGVYTVIFEYDTNKYLPTTYQAQGIEESINSNVVKSTYEGKQVATTNKINITDRSIANINIGLVQGSNFDLSLNKVVTKMSYINTKTSKTKEYNTQLAKIDLDYKYINNTQVAVEYEITVTNEGDIPGTATKIVDYLPEGFDFSTELNKDWYTSGSNIQTKSLENEVINPGERKTVTLVLTKNMTENDNGIYANTAEIAETYNEFGEKDSDSTPANNLQSEDDISTANVILGLKTGGPVTYVTLTITIMALICIGAYEINKKVLKI